MKSHFKLNAQKTVKKHNSNQNQPSKLTPPSHENMTQTQIKNFSYGTGKQNFQKKKKRSRGKPIFFHIPKIQHRSIKLKNDPKS